MALDTSLIFDLVARDHTGEGLSAARDAFDGAATGIAASVGAALGYGIANSMDMQAANAKLAAQLGLGTAEAAQVGKISGQIYADNWGDSTETINTAIKGVYQNIGEGNAAWVKDTSEKAVAIGDIFDQDVGGVTASVGQLMKTGLVDNASEAFDVITRGFQSGADKSGDFLDTLNEYSVQWSKFGLDAQTATGLLSQGLQAGARDGDLVADAIKEFSIRAIDGSTTTAAGFQAIGLNAKKMAADIAAGGPTASAALDLTLDKLRDMKDPVAQSAAATALFGTQAEDLGAALYALDPSSAVQALGQVGGAADQAMAAMSESPAAKLETAKRQIQMKLTEIGGVIVGWAMQHTDVVKPLTVALGAIAAVIMVVKAGMIVWTVAQNLWSAATAVATAATWLWNAALDANPIMLIVIAIIAVIAILVILWFKVDGFREAMITAFHAVTDAVMWFFNGAMMVFGKIGDFFSNLPGWIGGFFSAAGQWLADAGSKIIEGLWWGIKLYFKIIEFWYIGLPLLILGYFASAAMWLLGKGGDIIAGLWRGVSNGWSIGVGFLTSLGAKVLSAPGNAASWLYQLGRDVISGMMNGVQSMARALMDKVTSVVKAPINAAKSILHIGSPSRLWRDEVGLPIAQGLAVGVIRGVPLVDRAVGDLASAAMPVPVAAAPLSARAVGGDGASAPTSVTINISTPLLDRQAAERLGQILTPVLQRSLRSYSLSNGGTTNITI